MHYFVENEIKNQGRVVIADITNFLSEEMKIKRKKEWSGYISRLIKEFDYVIRAPEIWSNFGPIIDNHYRFYDESLYISFVEDILKFSTEHYLYSKESKEYKEYKKAEEKDVLEWDT